jgi:anti-anti-sigma factor
MQMLQDQSDTSLELTGDLDIDAAVEVHKALLAYLEHHARIWLDLSKIECCDAAGVQLLVAAQRSAEAAGKPFAIIAVTEAFTTVCASLGISSGQFIAATSPLLEPACMGKESIDA